MIVFVFRFYNYMFLSVYTFYIRKKNSKQITGGKKMDLVSVFNPVRYGKIKHFQFFSNHENKN